MSQNNNFNSNRFGHLKRITPKRFNADIVRVEQDSEFGYNNEPLNSTLEEPFFTEFTFEAKRQFGPIQKRSCTDVFCLLIFIAFLVSWVFLIFYFSKFVDLNRTFNPSDTYGNVCGQGKFKDKPYLAFFNIFVCAHKVESSVIDGCQTPQVCVEHCPNVTFSINLFDNAQLRRQELEHVICLYNITPTVDNLWTLVNQGLCAQYYFNSQPVAGRCLPAVLRWIQSSSHEGGEILNDLTNNVMKGNDSNAISVTDVVKNNDVIATLMKAFTWGTKVANDIVKTWQYILLGLLSAMILAFFWIFLMQWMARYMIWLSIFAIIILNGVGLFYSWSKYQDLHNPSSTDANLPNVTNQKLTFRMASEWPNNAALNYIREIPVENSQNNLQFELDLNSKLKDELQSYLKNETTWFILSIVLAVTLCIVTFLFFCLCRRISLAIAVIEEASKAVSCMKSTLFFPVVPYVLKIVTLGGCLVAAIIIAAGSHPQYRYANGTFCEPHQLSEAHFKHLNIMEASVVTNNATNHHHMDTNCTFTRPFTKTQIYGAHAYNLFGIIWVLFFFMGLCYVTLSGTFASYYWTFHKDEVPFFALLSSFSRCVCYHLGSIAFGSLLVAVVRFIRIILEFIDNKCKKYADYAVARAVMCLLKCCFWCLENFIKFINKNAYIMIAIYGKNFCASAKDAFMLLVDNGIRTIVLNCLSDFLIFISKVAVTSLVGVLGFFVLTNRVTSLVEFHDLNYYWAPLTVLVVLSYIVISSFFNVYDVAIETIFMCYLEDCKVNDGSRERPYYMAKSLAKVFKTHNRRPK